MCVKIVFIVIVFNILVCVRAFYTLIVNKECRVFFFTVCFIFFLFSTGISLFFFRMLCKPVTLLFVNLVPTALSFGRAFVISVASVVAVVLAVDIILVVIVAVIVVVIHKLTVFFQVFVSAY